MASLRNLIGKYENSKYHIIRFRRPDGSYVERVTDHLVEPPGMKPSDPGYAKAKEALRLKALEEAKDAEAFNADLMDEEDLAQRAVGRAKYTKRAGKAPSCGFFIVAWVCEHIIRNRLSAPLAYNICNLMDYLLSVLQEAGCKSIKDIREKHITKVMNDLRTGSYSADSANIGVVYLRSLAGDLRKATGRAVGGGLFKEAKNTAERFGFCLQEICWIIAALPKVVPDFVEQWTVFILVMLYTEERPGDDAQVTLGHFRWEGPILLMLVESSKTDGFDGKEDWQPVHRCLQRHLEPLLKKRKDSGAKPEDSLLPSLALEDRDTLGLTFNNIIAAAEVEVPVVERKHRLNNFRRKTLYSVKHTGCTWREAARSAKENAGHLVKTKSAIAHYLHSVHIDAPLLRQLYERINAMPDVDEAMAQSLAKPGTAPGQDPSPKKP